jgi:hypothetical protein
MRILNRPMFKYGGPIKEGLMHGMKNGGNVGAFNVGSPVKGMFPKDATGREHHLGPAAIPVGLGLNALRLGVMRLGSRYLMPLLRKQVGTKMTPGSVKVPGQVGTKGRFLPENVKTIQKQGPSLPKYEPTWLGKDPIVKGVGWAGSKVPVKGAWNFATSPSSLIIGGVTWYNWPDGTQRKTPPPGNMIGAGPLHGAKDMIPDDAKIKTKSPEELAAEAKAARTKKLNKYLDTMGYDKAKKTAMGDALIDASAIVQDATTEAGSLKKADWGKMINRAIQSTSKRLDKPEQIREAVGLMMTKADIEKDMNADENQLNNDYKRMQIALGEKSLAGTSFEDIISDRMIKGDMLKGNDLASLLRIKKGIDAQVISTAGMDADQDALTYVTKLIEEKEGTPYPEGVYVISDRIVKVDAQGNVKKVL